MAVYVDKGRWPYGRMKMCHMLADTVNELHGMADKLGLKREWFQNHKTPHYDICQQKKQQALNYGAIEISNKEVVKLIRQYREQQSFYYSEK